MPPLFRYLFPSRAHAIVCLPTLGVGFLLLCPRPVQASASHRQSRVAYARATAIQHRLEAIPDAERTRPQYERALDAYRAVYHGDPASPDAARSIAAVADLLASEGRCFHDAKLSRDAVAQWEFLRRQYPTSSLRQRALLEQGEIEQHDLHDRAAAKKSYRLFLAQYPQDSLAEKARAGLRDEPVVEASTSHKRAPQRMDGLLAETSSRTEKQFPPEKTGIRSSEQSHATLLADAPDMTQRDSLTKATVPVKPLQPATIQDVRYWAENDTTRLAVDLSDAAPYHTYSARDGRQITIIFFGAHSAAALLGHTIATSHDDNLGSMRVSMLTGDQATVVLQLKRPVSFASFVLSNPSRLILDLHPALATDFAQSGIPSIRQSSSRNSPTSSAQIRTPAPPKISSNMRAANSAEGADGVTPVAGQPQLPAYPVEPATNAQHSMARVLGLRVRRIVIDAGHGGHDSGTIGPDGLEEKDIALDVALRLGRLLQQRLGAEVIYTRRTDKYVPLEERTAIANEAHADLFLSIHANSSSDPQVRGVETYFLNFTASPDAMAVAGRENADSNRSVHELSDLVRKIALSDKIDESREFAGDVQQQLYGGLSSGNPGLKNRGVKQAPFVVLIGAQMPSILAEISFLTNPDDAAELSQPRYRERLAEALYGGVAEYVQGMSGVRIAKTIPAEALADPAE
jgi:N-acetylmuramoyl-L-alanine amidase